MILYCNLATIKFGEMTMTWNLSCRCTYNLVTVKPGSSMWSMHSRIINNGIQKLIDVKINGMEWNEMKWMTETFSVDVVVRCCGIARNLPCLRTLLGVSYCILLRLPQGYRRLTAALIDVFIHTDIAMAWKHLLSCNHTSKMFPWDHVLSYTSLRYNIRNNSL